MRVRLMRFGQFACIMPIIYVTCLGVVAKEHVDPHINSCEIQRTTVSDDPKVKLIATAASAWLRSLDTALAQRASYCLGDPEMYSWTNVPGRRSGGIELRAMSREQQRLVWDLLRGLLSDNGFEKARLISTEITQVARAAPLGSHTVALFGDPRQEGAWGFQLDGHHLALNFLVQESNVVLAPAFFGTQPRSVDGRAPLYYESKLGRELIAAFNDEERALAHKPESIGRDVIVGSGRGQEDRGRRFDVSQFDGIGIPISALAAPTSNILSHLVKEYVHNLAGSFALPVEQAIFGALTEGYVAFDHRGDDIYYRVYIPNLLLIEYNDINADHVHTIFRLLGEAPFSDYGSYANIGTAPRTIAEHYAVAPHHRTPHRP